LSFFICPFYQESFFQWCFGAEEPGCYGALDLGTGASILFVPKLPPEYAIWDGKLHTLEDFKERYCVDEVYYTDGIARVLKEKQARLLLTLVSRAWEQMDDSPLSCMPSLQVRRKCSIQGQSKTEMTIISLQLQFVLYLQYN
jgi:hypothetical protein